MCRPAFFIQGGVVKVMVAKTYDIQMWLSASTYICMLCICMNNQSTRKQADLHVTQSYPLQDAFKPHIPGRYIPGLISCAEWTGRWELL